MSESYIIRPGDETTMDNCRAYIRGLDRNKAWRIEIKRYQKRRSLDQNALLHKWFGVIADATGDDAVSIKEELKTRFSPRIEYTAFGQTKIRPKGTSEMDVAEMSEFMTKVEALAGQFDIALPHPDDQFAAAAE